MKPLAFVVVYNLMGKDIKNCKKLGEIERATINSIGQIDSYEATEDNLIFSFPFDPSVITPMIPVFVHVTLFKSASFPCEISAQLRGKLRRILPGRKAVVYIQNIGKNDALDAYDK